MKKEDFLFLSGVLSESQYFEAKDGDHKHYMFFSNLKVIKEKVDKMLAMDAGKIDAELAKGHDWASDHITSSRDDIEEVYNWLTSRVR
ncbi:MAG: hypothetical protein EBS89_08545 [Proteobacteria bacterium]|nr:hypothetical protein [Pseudomonadota bacterium]